MKNVGIWSQFLQMYRQNSFQTQKFSFQWRVFKNKLLRKQVTTKQYGATDPRMQTSLDIIHVGCLDQYYPNTIFWIDRVSLLQVVSIFNIFGQKLIRTVLVQFHKH